MTKGLHIPTSYFSVTINLEPPQHQKLFGSGSRLPPAFVLQCHSPELRASEVYLYKQN